MCDMLGDFSDVAILRETLSLFIFGESSEHSTGNMSVVLNLMTQPMPPPLGVTLSAAAIAEMTSGRRVAGADKVSKQPSVAITPTRPSQESIATSTANTIGQPASAAALTLHPPVDLVSTERALMGILTCSQKDIISATVPSKFFVTEYLKFVRRLLNASQWRLGDLPLDGIGNGIGNGTASRGVTRNGETVGGVSAGAGAGAGAGISGAARRSAVIDEESSDDRDDVDVYEFFAVLNLLSILCKAIVLAYNNLEKQRPMGSNSNSVPADSLIVSFGTLMQSLQPGTKSDLANAFLEAVNYSSDIWKLRYENVSFFHSEVAEESKNGSLNKPSSTNSSRDIIAKVAVPNFLRTLKPEMPGVAVVRIIGDTLAISLDDIMKKFFRNT